jgi:type II secretory pathway pseudopilin PulG
MSIKPSKRHWRGSPLSHNYTVVARTAEPAEGEPAVHKAQISADASMVQEPILPHWLLRAVLALAALAGIFVILWFTVLKPQIHSTAQSEVSKQLASAGIVAGTTPTTSSPPTTATSSSATSKPASSSSTTSAASAGFTINGSSTASGNGTQTFYVVPSGHSLEITDIVVQNPGGSDGVVSLARSGTVLIQWSLATFRDLDYHWITPTVFGPGTDAQLIISGCPPKATCSAGLYYAGTLVKS